LPFAEEDNLKGKFRLFAPEFRRWVNHLANQFAISCAVGWVLAIGQWQTPCHNIVISKNGPFTI
jgi:hypothetical protein